MLRTLCVALGLFLVAAGPVLASVEDVTIPARGATVISDPETGDFRVLLSFPGLDAHVGRRTHMAWLELPHVSLAGRASIEAFAVSTAWSAGTTTWTSPWETAGGDFNPRTRGACRFRTSERGSAPYRINVTPFVFDVIDEDGDNYGLLLKAPDHFGGSFDAETEGALEAFGSAVIVARVSGGVE